MWKLLWFFFRLIWSVNHPFPSTYFLNCLFDQLKIPGSILFLKEQEAGYTLDESAIYYMTQSQAYNNLHSDQQDSSINRT